MRRVAIIVAVALCTVVALGVQGKEGSGYRVRAIFDSAAFVVPGEDVKIAGVRVGSIDNLAVTEENKAAVEFSISEPGYQDFREDATCTIRPQSLIGEQFIECALTQPRATGEELPPELPEADDGVRELPVEQTRASVPLDLLGNIQRLPVRQRLSLIVNELGIALAGRGEDLNDVIRRAAPALQEFNKTLDLLAAQNRVLKQLAVDSDEVLKPLAREREALTGFVKESTDLAAATVERRAELEQNFEKLPTFLAELQPTMRELEAFADQAIPVSQDLRAGAQDINDLIRLTGPFSDAATPALTSLGEVAEPGIPALRASLPIVEDLRKFGKNLEPVAKDLADTLVSFRKNDGVERLLDYLYFQVQAINGYDNIGHFLRAALVVNTCSTYSTTPSAECLSKFVSNDPSARSGVQPTGDKVLDRTARVLAGADPDDVLAEARQKRIKRRTARMLSKIEPAQQDDSFLEYLFGEGE